MGIDRCDDAALARLARLKMGVRVDREGILRVDYHTAKDVLKAGGGIKETELSNRYYLADALFLVGLQNDDLELLERIHAALCNPVWPLFLGRKAFLAGESIWLQDGLLAGTELKDALQKYPYLSKRSAPDRLRLALEDQNGVVVRSDQPLSFHTRRFAPRRLVIEFIPTPKIQAEAS
jgi:CRISPR system Cascade subunit CasD